MVKQFILIFVSILVCEIASGGPVLKRQVEIEDVGLSTGGDPSRDWSSADFPKDLTDNPTLNQGSMMEIIAGLIEMIRGGGGMGDGESGNNFMAMLNQQFGGLINMAMEMMGQMSQNRAALWSSKNNQDVEVFGKLTHSELPGQEDDPVADKTKYEALIQEESASQEPSLMDKISKTLKTTQKKVKEAVNKFVNQTKTKIKEMRGNDKSKVGEDEGEKESEEEEDSETKMRLKPEENILSRVIRSAELESQVEMEEDPKSSSPHSFFDRLRGHMDNARNRMKGVLQKVMTATRLNRGSSDWRSQTDDVEVFGSMKASNDSEPASRLSGRLRTSPDVDNENERKSFIDRIRGTMEGAKNRFWGTVNKFIDGKLMDDDDDNSRTEDKINETGDEPMNWWSNRRKNKPKISENIPIPRAFNGPREIERENLNPSSVVPVKPVSPLLPPTDYWPVSTLSPNSDENDNDGPKATIEFMEKFKDELEKVRSTMGSEDEAPNIETAVEKLANWGLFMRSITESKNLDDFWAKIKSSPGSETE